MKRTTEKSDIENLQNEKDKLENLFDKKPTSSNPQLAPTPQQQQEQLLSQNQKVAITNIRKCHTAWDGAKRDFEAATLASQAHPNTRGGRVEQDLAKIVSECAGCDAKLLAFEARVKTGGQLSEADIKEAAAVCTELSEGVKTGHKKAAGLRSMMKILGVE